MFGEWGLFILLIGLFAVVVVVASGLMMVGGGLWAAVSGGVLWVAD